MIICLHEKVAPYCTKGKNLVEIFLLLNIDTVFVVACAFNENSVIISILIILAMAKLVSITVLLNTRTQVNLTALYMLIVRCCSQKCKEIKRKTVTHQLQEPLIVQNHNQ